MFRVFRTSADLDQYLARRLKDFPWRLLAVLLFGFGLAAIAALTGKL